MGPLDTSPLSSIPVSFATVSIGCKPSHTLPQKLEALSEAGFSGIELGFPDLVSFACNHLGKKVEENDFDELVIAAERVKEICWKLGLEIMLLQPFANFEGWRQDEPGRRAAWDRVEGWSRILDATGCETLQVGSTDTPLEHLDLSLVVPDLQALSDRLARTGKRIAYENWCWSTHAPNWADVWRICKQVDRENFGLCLDTFQTAGGEWADPSSPNGILGGTDPATADKKLRASLEALAKQVPKDKIYLLQVSDAYKLSEPIRTNDETGLRPRGRWSHDFRPLPYDGGYLPVVDVATAVLQTGFRGWFSYEVFDGGPNGKGTQYDLSDFARKAKDRQARLMTDCVAKAQSWNLSS